MDVPFKKDIYLAPEVEAQSIAEQSIVCVSEKYNITDPLTGNVEADW